LSAYPEALVLFAGAYKDIMGEEKYFQKLSPLIQKYEQEGHWRFLGNLDLKNLATFYPNLDVLVVPSLNPTESFGLVQIEAMINGVPIIASDLPGVRQPVTMHEMGKIIPIGDSTALEEAMLEILADPQKFHREAGPIAHHYLPDSIAIEYENLFSEIQDELRPKDG
jgi:glycosyltransferase involved in cell wall biosynthesis